MSLFVFKLMRVAIIGVVINAMFGWHTLIGYLLIYIVVDALILQYTESVP